MLLGDARTGKLADNLVGFGRALRRAGVRTDAASIALAQQAIGLTGVERKDDLAAGLEAVLIHREADRVVFRQLFDAFFRDPQLAHKLLSQMLPTAEGKAEVDRKRKPRVREALAPQQAYGTQKPKPADKEVEFDAAMTASDVERLRHADFAQMSASEFALVERLARDVPLRLPEVAARRVRPGPRGARLHWPHLMRAMRRHDGDPLVLPRLQRRVQPLPLLALVDVSGSMERYARLLLAFLHAATRSARAQRGRADVFAFGTHLTDLTAAFAKADGDEMLEGASALIDDFAGGTRLGESLATLHAEHARRLVGRRTLVLLVTDGLDTGEPELLERELLWLRRASRRVVWLNPLLRFDGYQPLARGAALLHRHSDAMLAVHNIEKLEDLARALARLVRNP